jgi:ankyrin repeat protein
MSFYNVYILLSIRCAYELLQKGADPNYVLEDGATPFHLAVGLEDEALSAHFTHLLLEFGANPNVR